jgi:hypothetical protein
VEGGNPVEAAGGQEAEQLELGVHACLQPAVHLEHHGIVEHDRRVGLLGAHGPVRGQGDLRRGALDELELDRAVLEGRRLLRADAVHQLAGELRVPERVVHRVALRLSDHALAPARVRRAEPDGHVVRVVRALGKAHLDEAEREVRLDRAREGRVPHADVRELARLRTEPALPDHERAQRILRDPADDLRDVGRHVSPASGSRSWNQKNPRGASVSR